jgi:hypothetical protein
VLIAEDCVPEVILTADWLSAQHGGRHLLLLGVDAEARTERLVRFQLDYPLRELQDIYRIRQRTRTATQTTTGQTWDDVKRWIDFDWSAWFIDLCRKVKDGLSGTTPKTYSG